MTGRQMGNAAGLLSIAAIVLVVAVRWRHHYPVAFTAVGCVSACLALGPTLDLIGLMPVITWRPHIEALRLAPVVVRESSSIWRGSS